VLELEFSARSLAPRNMVVRADGRELWRGMIGPQLSERQSVRIPVVNGRAVLEFSSDTPATRAGESGDPRALAFALYDARLVVPEP
jgi:hypothetical protein